MMTTPAEQARPDGAEFRAAAGGGRRRRPTGKAPPLPREINRAAWIWLFLAVAAIVFTIGWLAGDGDTAMLDRWNDLITTTIGRARTGTAHTAAEIVAWFSSDLWVRILRLATIVVLVIFRRWQRLLIFIVTLIVLGIIFAALDLFTTGQQIETADASSQALVVSNLTATLVLMGYCLCPSGRTRNIFFAASAGYVVIELIALASLAELLAADLVSIPLAVAVSVLAMQLFAHDSVFPIVYERKGQTAHLDLGGRRGEAIRTAIADQLGWTVTEIEPFGGASSAGSTPMRLRVTDTGDTGGNQRTVFAKLYSKSHLRSDRLYKTWRTIAYGSLEDERAFETVRRLVQYEDYVMLAMHRAGLPVAQTYGFVELAPETEYALVTELFDGAVEISDAEIGDTIIDEALEAVRYMWDAGFAHRDIKPANLLVVDGRLEIIDLAFSAIRPSPWRQAVDLANMMLILALGAGAERVYDAAKEHFHPNEIAEAFAATRGPTIPRQLREKLDDHKRETGIDLVAEFRRLAPDRRPIAIQRWSFKRVMLTGAALVTAAIVVGLIIDEIAGDGFL